MIYLIVDKAFCTPAGICVFALICTCCTTRCLSPETKWWILLKQDAVVSSSLMLVLIYTPTEYFSRLFIYLWAVFCVDRFFHSSLTGYFLKTRLCRKEKFWQKQLAAALILLSDPKFWKVPEAPKTTRAPALEVTLIVAEIQFQSFSDERCSMVSCPVQKKGLTSSDYDASGPGEGLSDQAACWAWLSVRCRDKGSSKGSLTVNSDSGVVCAARRTSVWRTHRKRYSAGRLPEAVGNVERRFRLQLGVWQTLLPTQGRGAVLNAKWRWARFGGRFSGRRKIRWWWRSVRLRRHKGWSPDREKKLTMWWGEWKLRRAIPDLLLCRKPSSHGQDAREVAEEAGARAKEGARGGAREMHVDSEEPVINR